MATGRLPDPNSAPVTAKGDLYTYSTVPAKLAVGSNGETLVADSSTSTGLRYQPVNNGNFFINGAMDIWQRGTSFSNIGAYTADRCYFFSGAGTWTISRTTSNIPSAFQYGWNISNSSASAAGGYLYQTIETAMAILLAGKTVTLSAWVRSSNSGTFVAGLEHSSNTDEGQSGSFTAITGTNTSWASSTTSTRFAAQFSVPSTAKSLRLSILSPNLSSSASATITGVQLEIGSVATEFRRAGGNIAGELAACQRYFYRHIGEVAKYFGNAYNFSATNAASYIQFPVTMRTSPTLSAASGTNYYTMWRNGASDDFNSLSSNSMSTTGGNVYNSSEISGTAGHAGAFYTNSASATVDFSSEL